jgi:phosphoribosylamine--glycine ligase
MPRIKTDLAELFLATAKQRLKETNIQIDPRYAVTVMAVSGGYPETYDKGKKLSLPENPQGILFHAGTTLRERELVTSGGRVICATSYGNSLREALDNSYAILDKIHFNGMYYRRDIGADLLLNQNKR